MALNGKIFEANSYKIFFTSSSSNGTSSFTGAVAGGTASFGHAGSLVTQFTPNAIATSTGISFTWTSASGPNTWSVTYTGPGAPLGVTYTGSPAGTVSGYFEITNLKVYNIGGNYVLQGSYEVVVQGVSRLTGSLNELSGGLGPAYIPIIGIPAKITGSASAAASLPATTREDIWSYEVSCDATVIGGWGFDQGDGYVYLPVSKTGSAPSVSCTDPGVGSVSASDTGDLTVTSYSYNAASNTFHSSGTVTSATQVFYCDDVEVDTTVTPNDADWDIYYSEGTSISRSGNIMGVPDLEKSITRLNSDFGALFYRTEFPQTLSAGAGVCPDGTTTNGGEVHPYQDEILLEVGSSVSAMENTFDYNSYAPWGHSGSYSYNKNYSLEIEPIAVGESPACGEGEVLTEDLTLSGGPPELEDEFTSSSRSFSFPTSVGTEVAGYLSHSNGIARYINSWCNPHWSFLLWNEPWEMDGTKTWNDYWAKIGQQYLFNTGITSSLIRNHLVSEPCNLDSNRSFLDSFVGGLSFIGVSRFNALTYTPLSNYTYSASNDNLYSGDYSLGSGITVDGTFELSLRSLTEEPFMYPALANKFVLDWTGDFDVYIKDSLGSKVLLTNTPGTFNKVKDINKTPVGTWIQDYDVDDVDDIGVGFKATSVKDAIKCVAPGSFAGYGAVSLVFEGSGVLDYPELVYDTTFDVVWETPFQAALVPVSGEVLRFGCWKTGDSNTIVTPSYREPEGRPDLISGLIWGYNVVQGEAGDIPTLLGSLYDSYEGQAVGNHRDSYCFLLPKTNSFVLAMVNSYSEVPPLGVIPTKNRDTDWLYDDWAQNVYTHAANKGYVVSSTTAGTGIALSPTLTGTILSSASNINSYKLQSYNMVNTGYHNVLDVARTDPLVGLTRPWRGFCYFDGEELGGTRLAAATGKDKKVYFGYVDDEVLNDKKVVVQVRDAAKNLLRDYTVDGTEVALTTDINQNVLSLVVDGDLKIYDVERETLMKTITTSDGTNPVIANYPDGSYRVYWVENNYVYVTRLDNDFNTLQAKTACTGIGEIDPDGIAGVSVKAVNGFIETHLAVMQNDDLVIYSSTNAVAFS